MSHCKNVASCSFVIRALRVARLGFPSVAIAICGLNAQPAAAASCESLKSLALPNATIVSAESVAAGAFTPPTPARGGAGAASLFSNLPAFCRVQAAVKRAGDTDVKIEIWMPAQGWNGDFQPAASGFGGGTIGYGSQEGGMSEFLRRGSATGATNRG